MLCHGKKGFGAAARKDQPVMVLQHLPHDSQICGLVIHAQDWAAVH
jgi:hypothetical protein